MTRPGDGDEKSTGKPILQGEVKSLGKLATLSTEGKIPEVKHCPNETKYVKCFLCLSLSTGVTAANVPSVQKQESQTLTTRWAIENFPFLFPPYFHSRHSSFGGLRVHHPIGSSAAEWTQPQSLRDRPVP